MCCKFVPQPSKYIYYLQGDPLFVDFLEMLQKNPDEFTFTSLEDGLKALQNERAVMHIESQLLRGYFTQNLFFNQRLKMFGRTRTIFNAMPVPINSPLKPILQTAVTNLVEGGAIGKKNVLKNFTSIQNTFGKVPYQILSPSCNFTKFLVQHNE